MRALKFLPVVALILGCQSTPQPVARTWELPAGVKTMQVNGYDMAYVERGSGDPVIFVHGAGVDYRYWAAQMEPFSAKFRTIAVSLRRYYPEPWRGDGDFSLNQQVADLEAFIRQLNAGPVHLVGHSRGGSVALYTTSKIPRMVRTLTFAEGGTGMPAFFPTDPVLAERRGIALRAMTEKLKKGETEAGLEIFMDYVSGPGAWKTTSDGTKNSLRANAWTLAAAEIDTPTWAPYTCEDARRLNVPVLLLEGESTPGTFKATLDNVQACLPRNTRGVVKNSSHGTPRANPQGFNTAVMTFIAAH
ncbi:alpha/beta fold hydrolase [Variovorax sp. RT4R15]|uniref:alpha/beta fold hydrolase n=1 Tax=Variovorax sp. RT4R15 TaxID=3443737 RepID=UPI003F478356